MLRRLTISHRRKTESVEPQYSRKTGRVTVIISLGKQSIYFSIAIKRLDKMIDGLTRHATGTGPLQLLYDGLSDARLMYGHIIERKKKNRGRQSGRSLILYHLQYASAWTYAFLRYQWGRYMKDRLPLLQEVRTRFIQRLEKEDCAQDWVNLNTARQITFLTAYLVGNSYAKERDLHKLADPLSAFSNFNGDSFYRTYIQPKLKHVESRVEKRPNLLASLSNGYLRRVFRFGSPEESLSEP